MDSLVLVAVALVGGLAVVNLVFTLAVVRRLREHSELLANRQNTPMSSLAVADGNAVADFTTATIDGTNLSRASIDGPTVVAFLSPGCGPCTTQLPEFADAARHHPGGRAHSIAVIVTDDPASAASYVASLTDVAQIVIEEPGGVLCTAFGSQGYPSFAVLDAGGVVRISTVYMRDLPVPTAA